MQLISHTHKYYTQFSESELTKCDGWTPENNKVNRTLLILKLSVFMIKSKQWRAIQVNSVQSAFLLLSLFFFLFLLLSFTLSFSHVCHRSLLVSNMKDNFQCMAASFTHTHSHTFTASANELFYCIFFFLCLSCYIWVEFRFGKFLLMQANRKETRIEWSFCVYMCVPRISKT